MVFWDEKTIDGLDETRITNIAQKIRTFDGWSRERQPRKTENEFSYDRLTMIQPRSDNLRFGFGFGFVLVVYSAGQRYRWLIFLVIPVLI